MLLALTMRSTGLGSGAYKNDPDFVVYSGAWQIGRIYEEPGSPQRLRWYWSLHGILGKPLELRTDGQRSRPRRPSLMASWKRWLEWAKLGEVQ